MTDKTRQILTQAGVDIDAAKERMMGNEKLLLRMLFKINSEKNYADLTAAFEKKSIEEAVQVTHALKGLFGGLSVMPLYDLFTRQTALLRAGDFSAAESLLSDARSGLDALKEALVLAKQAEENE